MAYIDGKEIFFSPTVNIQDDSKHLPEIREAILTKGGNFRENDGMAEVASAIYDLRVGDSAYVETIDSDAKMKKPILSGAVEKAILNTVGGKSIKSKNLLNPQYIADVVNSHIDGIATVTDEGYVSFKGTIPTDAFIEIPFEGLKKNTSYKFIILVSGNGEDFGCPPTAEILQSNDDGIVDYLYLNSLVADENYNALDCVADAVVGFMLTEDTTATEFSRYSTGLSHALVTAIESHGSENVLDPQIIADAFNEQVEGIATVTEEGYVALKGTIPADAFINPTIGGLEAVTIYKYGYFLVSGSIEGLYMTEPCEVMTDDNCAISEIVMFPQNTDVNIDAVIGFMISKGSNERFVKYGAGTLIEAYEIPKEIQELDGYGKEFTHIDFDKKEFVNEGFDFVLQNVKASDFLANFSTSNNGCNVAFDVGKPFIKFVSTDAEYGTSKFGELYGNNSGLAYWVGILNILGFLNAEDLKDGEGKINHDLHRDKWNTALAQFAEHCNKRAEDGNPITFRFKCKNEADIIRKDISAYLTDYDSPKTIDVVGGGHIKFVNENELNVPSKITYIRSVT